MIQYLGGRDSVTSSTVENSDTSKTVDVYELTYVDESRKMEMIEP